MAVGAGAPGVQAATTTVPRPEATNPSALRRLSLTVSLVLDIKRAFLDLHESDVCADPQSGVDVAAPGPTYPRRSVCRISAESYLKSHRICAASSEQRGDCMKTPLLAN